MIPVLGNDGGLTTGGIDECRPAAMATNAQHLSDTMNSKTLAGASPSPGLTSHFYPANTPAATRLPAVNISTHYAADLLRLIQKSNKQTRHYSQSDPKTGDEPGTPP